MWRRGVMYLVALMAVVAPIGGLAATTCGAPFVIGALVAVATVVLIALVSVGGVLLQDSRSKRR